MNISSGALDQQEVSTIAGELRQQLNTASDTTQVQTPNKQDETEDDTIAIDHDGTLHVRN